MENNIIELLKEIVALLKERHTAAPPAPPASPVVADNFTCAGTTAKGKPCTNKCIENSQYCGMHGGNKKRKTTSAASSTNAKIIPTHDHDVDEVSSNCDLCVQHGDALNPTVVAAQYTMEERLKQILQSCNTTH